MKKVLIAAGGTGGHVFPALVVADKLKQQGVEVRWVCSTRGLEKRVVQPFYKVTYLSLTGLRGNGLRGYLALPFKMTKAILSLFRLFVSYKPDVVLTMGSFVSGPSGVMAKMFFTPLVIHEQNARPGMTNRLLAKMADRVLQAFPGPFDGRAVFTVGNPVRESIRRKSHHLYKAGNKTLPLRVLVLGGSQGALALNHSIFSWWKDCAPQKCISLWHQTGEKHLESMLQLYSSLDGERVRCDGFIDDMNAAYEWADLVICRSGALTVSEVAVAGLPAIFIPLPSAVDDHQYFNARWLVDKQAAWVLRQSECHSKALQNLLMPLIEDRQVLATMGDCSRVCANLTAVDDIISHLTQSCKKNNTDTQNDTQSLH